MSFSSSKTSPSKAFHSPSRLEKSRHSISSLILKAEPGITLKDYLNTKNLLSIKFSSSPFICSISILTQVHKAGIVHKDIKPENKSILIPNKLPYSILVSLKKLFFKCNREKRNLRGVSFYMATE